MISREQVTLCKDCQYWQGNNGGRDKQDEEYHQDWVSDWLYGRVCDDCPKKECCEENVFRCKNVLFVMLGKEALKDGSTTDYQPGAGGEGLDRMQVLRRGMGNL